MIPQEKEIVQDVVRRYLERAEPELLARIGPTLASLLDISYDTVTQTAVEGRDEGGELPETGPPIDASLGEAAVIAAATWIATILFRHARAALRAGREPELDAVEQPLAERSGFPTAVPELRDLVLERLSEVLLRLERLEEPPLPYLPDPKVWPELLLLADFDRRSRRLRFQLRSRPGDAAEPPTWSGEPLRRDPYDYMQSLSEQIRALRRSAPGVARDRLTGIGAQLSRELLPPELRGVLAAAGGGSPSLEIVSEETWVPWELLYLDDGADGGFLGETFAVTRWRVGLDHRLQLRLRRVAVVVSRGELEQAEREAGDFHRRQGVLETERIEARHQRLREALISESHDVWHFIGHHQCRDTATERWSLPLEDYEVLAEFDLQQARRNLEATRPLVFLNACGTGKGGLSLAGPGGLAERFLELGAGAVVAVRWEVGDGEARAFAGAFYDAFLGGTPLGESARRARLEVKALHPASPGWLAYTVCGHPLAARAAEDVSIGVLREGS